MAQEKRKPFKGKKLHKDLRDYKNQEIKRSLVHRARLRKNYFKLLEKEGVPAGQEPNRPGSPESGAPKKDTRGNYSEDESNSGSEEEPDSQNEEGEETQTDASFSRKRHGAPLPPQRDLPKKIEVPPKRKPLNFAERAKLARERKEQKREDELRRVQERRQKIEQSQKDREKKKLSLQQRTRRGQPVMGPKITDLLDKIRHNG